MSTGISTRGGGPDAPIGGLGAAGLAILVQVVFVVVLGVAAAVQARRLHVSVDQALTLMRSDRLALGFAQLAGLALSLALGLLIYRRRVPLARALHLVAVRPTRLALACVAGFALQFPLAELGNVLRLLIPMEHEQEEALQRLLTIGSPRDAIEVFVLLCVLAPVGEELLFRGLLLPGLRARYGAAAAVLGSALLFGVVHVEPVAAIVAGTVGLLLGALALRAGSSWPPIALHFGFNAAPVVLQRELVRIEGFNTIDEGVYHLPPWLVAAGLLVSIAALAAFERLGAGAAR